GLVVGPGKVELLEHIRDTGSISAAGRRMRMSYRRAWDLVDAMNRHFASPVVETATGGAGGGGARLTGMGEDVIAHYRRIQARATEAVGAGMAALHQRLAWAQRPPPPTRSGRASREGRARQCSSSTGIRLACSAMDVVLPISSWCRRERP